VCRADVETTLAALAVPAAEEPCPPGDGATTVVSLTRVQQRIAARMTEAGTTVPDFQAEVDIDMAPCVAFRTELAAALGDSARPPSYNDLILRACALVLRNHPRVNGSYRAGAFEEHADVNVGFAVAAPGALLVPVVRQADRLSLAALAVRTRALATAAREGTASPSDLSGGTFTVSNLGGLGVDRFTAVINVPQAAILAVGAMRERPWGVQGEIRLRPIVTARLSCDHRIVYGADAAAFLSDLRRILERPLLLTL
jgi:pyruvate dehydrogenase E2 component (dihydrolipoamide acetyltransferase)